MAKLRPKEIQALIDEANGLRIKSDWKKAVEVLDAVPKDPADDPITMRSCAEAMLLRGYCQSELSELTKAIEDYERALKLAETLKDHLLQGKLHARLSNAHWRKGDRDHSIKHLEKAQKYADLTQDLWLNGVVHLERATIMMLVQKPEVIEKEYREAILVLEKAGDTYELCRAYNNLATSHIFCNNHKRAAELFEKCKRIAVRGGHDPYLAWGCFNKAVCLTELGQLSEALGELDRAIPILERTHDDFGLEGAQQAYGLIFARLKDYDKAEEHFLRARSLAKKCEMPFAEGEVLHEMGRMYSWKGDKQRALRFLKESREIFLKLVATHEVEQIDREIKEIS